MNPDRILRTALSVTAVFNIVVALVASMPDSALGQAAGLPSGVPLLYALLLAWTIALFGLFYGWLARQAEIQRPLVAFGALGKGAWSPSSSLSGWAVRFRDKSRSSRAGISCSPACLYGGSG